MTTDLSNAVLIRLAVLALAVGLLALACGPASPVGQDQQKPICTAETWNTDCIKPTDPPMDTPAPTPTTPPEIAFAERPEEVLPTATPTPLSEQIADTIRNGDYDAIARVKVVSHRRVKVTPTYDFFITDWIRSRVKVAETLRGSLPANIDLAIPAGALNGALDIDGEYILFLHFSMIDEGRSPYTDDPTRIPLNQTQLDEFGGEAFIYLGRQAWAVDGATVYRIPVGHITSCEAVAITDHDVAKANGETMTLAALKELFRPTAN